MYHLSGVDRGEATVLLYENRASKIYAAIVDICARMTNTCGTRFCSIISNIYHSQGWPKMRWMWLSLPSCAWSNKLDSTLEILFLTACAVFLPIHSSQSAQTARAEGEGPPPRLPSPGRWRGTSSVLASLGTQAEGEE